MAILNCNICHTPLETCECDMVARVEVHDLEFKQKNLITALKYGYISWFSFFEQWRNL